MNRLILGVSSENLIPVSQLEPLKKAFPKHWIRASIKPSWRWSTTLPARCGENEIKTLKICVKTKKGKTTTGWWFGTCFIFHNIWDNPNWRTHIFHRSRYTTKQNNNNSNNNNKEDKALTFGSDLGMDIHRWSSSRVVAHREDPNIKASPVVTATRWGNCC